MAEDTFRPPWYHRNLMSEFMGLVYGQYDAKPEGFRPGGMSLHNSMVPHGPDAEACDKASNATLAPHKLDHTLAFMFESRWRFKVTDFALNGGALDAGYGISTTLIGIGLVMAGIAVLRTAFHILLFVIVVFVIVIGQFFFGVLSKVGGNFWILRGKRRG